MTENDKLAEKLWMTGYGDTKDLARAYRELRVDRDKQFNEVTRLLTIFLAAISDIRDGDPESAFDILCRGMGMDPEDPSVKDSKFLSNYPVAE